MGYKTYIKRRDNRCAAKWFATCVPKTMVRCSNPPASYAQSRALRKIAQLISSVCEAGGRGKEELKR